MLRMTAMVLALAFLVPLRALASTAVVEFYNANLDHYFITWVPDEIAKLDAGTTIRGWVRTGREFRAYSSAQGGASPVCRFYIPPELGDSHFFGRGVTECTDTARANPSFTLEDARFMYMFLPVAGVCPSGTSNVYRVFSHRRDANHRYMTDTAVRDQMVARGWEAEGDGPNLVVMCAPDDGAARAAFSPTGNTTVGGAMYVTSATIPAGVTVTLASDFYLDATGAITMNGTLAGDCRNAALTAGGALAVAGSIDTHCTTPPAAAPPALTFVGKDGVSFTGGGTVTASGDVTITNDLASLAAATFDANGLPTALPLPPVAKPKAGPPWDCVSQSRIWLTTPVRAADGADGGPSGKDGNNARLWTLWCAEGGDGLIENTTVWGQDGGLGGLGTQAVAANAVATGGKGGAGGNLRVHVEGDLDFGANVTLNGGDGGSGGRATATSLPDGKGGTAPSATATSGKGGDAGLIGIDVGGRIAVQSPLTLNVGRGGASGNATASAAAGSASTANLDAQIGGTAFARSGDGGKTPRGTLRAGGNVTGAGNVTVTGGPGGNSGTADATGGRGGDGVTIPHPNGANGGNVTAVSGNGGNVETRDMAGQLVGNGGDAGDAIFRGGIGGNGYADCLIPLAAGGNGGKGGNLLGGSGGGGTGRVNGANGTTREIVVANGGNGGSGVGPGSGGAAGTANLASANPNAVVTQPSFVPGTRGKGCRFTVTIVVQTDPNPPHEGFVGYTSVNVLDVFIDNATGGISITGAAGSKWINVGGTFNKATGAFTTTGTGIAAGYANVPVTFDGTITFANGRITGVVTLGGGAAGLPQHSVSYTVNGTVQGAMP